MNNLARVIGTTIIVGLAGIAQAAPVTIDFENQPSGSCAFIGPTLTTQGFTFTKGPSSNAGFFQCNPGVLANNTTKALIEANGHSNWNMAEQSGAKFSLLSIQAGTRLEGGFSDSAGVRVTGTLFGGGTVQADLLFSGTAFTVFSLPSTFINLVSANFFAIDDGDPNYDEFAFDNIVVNVGGVDVPAPGALALLGLGLLGFGATRRRLN